MILIVDYGMGNLRSVAKALESLGEKTLVSSDASDVAKAAKLIVPGVGAFGAAMRELSSRGLVEPIKAAIASGKSYLGICLGLQLLFQESEENPGIPGLGVLKGIVRRFSFSPKPETQSPKLKIPHMGWNQVSRTQHTAHGTQSECSLLKEIPEGSFFYFVHSYYAQPSDSSMVSLESDYGVRFASMIWRGSLYATQFHPEKSQAIGLKLLENFIKL